ncbi:unnamed protein product [Symbiodinium microadriaticum]|nr:unnamed protein product [Symbiodinium microadriaticum]
MGTMFFGFLLRCWRWSVGSGRTGRASRPIVGTLQTIMMSFLSFWNFRVRVLMRCQLWIRIGKTMLVKLTTCLMVLEMRFKFSGRLISQCNLLTRSLLRMRFAINPRRN